MSWQRAGEEGEDLLFKCDFPKCSTQTLVWHSFEKGGWWCPTPAGQVVRLENETPTLMPIGWKSDGNSHFCWHHRIVFEPAKIVEDYTPSESPENRPTN